VVEFDIGDVETNRASGKQLLQALSKTLHSTDEVGWLDDHHIGVLLYNTTAERAQVFSKRFLELLPKVFIPPDFKIHTHPIGDQARDDSSYKGIKRRRTIQSSLFPQDATKEKTPEPVKQMRMLYSLAMPPGKRLIDIIGALVLLIIFTPFFLLVAFIIKIVSPGPVFFKWPRVVYGGKLFTLYKFRSMKINADTSAHKKYLAELIRETAGEKETGKPLKNPDDPQIMPFIGKVLRAPALMNCPSLLMFFSVI